MAYTPDIVPLPADFWTDRAGQKIVAIVAHGTGGTDSRGTLQHGDGRGVSIHVLISKTGRLYRMVSDDRGANHAGAVTSMFTLNGHTYSGGMVNKVTLGFELENAQTGTDPYPDAQLAAMGWLISDWRRQYGPLPILRHAELDPTRRRDPYQLPVQAMEAWATRYDTPLTKRYRVKHRYVTQRQEDNGPPIVRELIPGEELVIDKWYTNNRAHLASGEGFVDVADLEAI